VHLKLTLLVDKVLYSALALSEQSQQQASASATTGSSSAPAVSSGASGTSTLHVSGRVTSENPHVKKGAFHTLDLEVGRDFTIIKGIGSWDSVARQRIKEMTEPGRGADVGAIVCGEGESEFTESRLGTLSSLTALVSYHRSRKHLCHH
jgi:protein pelota